MNNNLEDLPIASLDAPLAKALSKVVGSSTRAGAKILHQPAYILHSQPYSETSLLLDVFTRNHGRLLVMAKGALRPYTRWRASIFQTFQTLSMGFSGKGAVRTLLDAEWVGGIPMLQGGALISGYYMNEWLMRALAREYSSDHAHAGLFDAYQHGLADLSLNAHTASEQAQVLRRFELALLSELGFAPDLAALGEIAVDASIGYDVAQQRWFHLPSTTANEDALICLMGQTVLDIRAGVFESPRTQTEAKALFQAMLMQHVTDKPLFTRQILRELKQLQTKDTA
ncbi:MAG: DNA repair protein RecO [Burkholderiales bacterium]|nr:DNA repair protein RecO [Burkholderiales bacterium]